MNPSLDSILRPKVPICIPSDLLVGLFQNTEYLGLGKASYRKIM